MAKNLIIYYSRKGENYVNGSIVDLKKGNTEICAEFIQKAVGGDLFEVETVNEYAKDYNTCIKEAQQELRQNARPELKKYLEDMTGKKIVIRPGRQKFDRVGTKDQKIPDITLVFDLCPGRAGVLFVPVPQLMSTHPIGRLDLNIYQFL